MVSRMSVLTPEDLSRLFRVDLDRIDCAGLKLTLGEVYKLESRGVLSRSGKELPSYALVEPDNGYYYLLPGPYYIKYNEYLKIPNGYIGLAIQRSSLIRMGVTLYTAVWDPGYEGRGSGLIVVHNPHGVAIERGVQVAQLVIIKMTGYTKKLYRGSYFREK